MLYRFIIFTFLMATWLVFSGMFDFFHVTLGVLSAGFVTWISSDLYFENRAWGLRRRLLQTFRLVHYMLWLLWQVILSNIDLLKLALSPSGLGRVQPRVVRMETGLKSDFEKFMLANSITLTPGTVTVKILGDVFYVHAISKHSAQGLDGEMERRIAAIFANHETEGGAR